MKKKKEVEVKMDKEIAEFKKDNNQHSIVEEKKDENVEITTKNDLLGKELINLEVFKTVSFEEKENYLFKAMLNDKQIYFFGSSVLNKQYNERVTLFKSVKILERDNLKKTRKYYTFEFFS